MTGSLTAIWPKVSGTICYIIHNLPKLLQSVSEHHWMQNMDILNTNAEKIAELALNNNHSFTQPDYILYKTWSILYIGPACLQRQKV